MQCGCKRFLCLEGANLRIEWSARLNKTAGHVLPYTPKSNTRNRIPGTNCTEIAVSCFGFRSVPPYAPPTQSPVLTQRMAYAPATRCPVLAQRLLLSAYGRPTQCP
eukprot:2560232-Rhodomonas_salina.2